MKKVAVILATYNGEKYLREQLESLAKQTYKNIDVYIHDDNSTDGTLSIIDEYTSRENECVKFILVDCESLRYPQCFIKTLLSIPKADYYAFCDQDDVWFENKIENAVKAIEDNGDEKTPCLYYSAVDYYDGDLNYIRGARFKDLKKSAVSCYSLQSMLFGGEAMGMTFLFNNEVRNVFEKTITLGGTDFKDTFIKIYCAACGVVIYNYMPCAKYRRHSGATTVGMNPSGKFSRLINMCKKIFIDKDGMQSIQESIDFINEKFSTEIVDENKVLMNLFARPNSLNKRIKKVFSKGRYRLKILDELGYRFAFLMGRV